jgi:hypothetical protein
MLESVTLGWLFQWGFSLFGGDILIFLTAFLRGAGRMQPSVRSLGVVIHSIHVFPARLFLGIVNTSVHDCQCIEVSCFNTCPRTRVDLVQGH